MKRLLSTSMMILALLTVMVTVPVVQSHADKADLKPFGQSRVGGKMLNITLGKGDVIDVAGDVADVLIANPAIADVVALQSRKLYIVGSQLGNTNMTLLDENGGVMAQYDINVKIDEKQIQAYLGEIYPNENVKIKALNDQVILTGSVSNPATASKISQVVAAYIGEIQEMKGTTDEIIVNLLQVRGEQQVMLKVKIFEASKTLLRELGIESDLGGTGQTLDNVNGILGSDGSVSLTRAAMATGALVFNDGNLGPLSLLASALEDENVAHILAEPNLTAISGEEAGFLAGGEFPVPGGRDDEGNVIIQFRSFGVSLNFRPTVMSEDRISLQLNTEVSSLARDESVTISGLDVPGLNVRRASTTVEVPSGGGLMIAGLLESQAVKGMSGLPGIRDVPVLGDLVSSRSFNRDESELIVMVTAYLVKPYAEQAAELKKRQDAPYNPVPVKHSSIRQGAPSPVPMKVEEQVIPVRQLGENDMPAIPPPQVAERKTKAPAAPQQDEPRSVAAKAAPVIDRGPVAAQSNSPLKSTFADNIRRIYGRKAPEMLNEDMRFGYLVQ